LSGCKANGKHFFINPKKSFGKLKKEAIFTNRDGFCVIFNLILGATSVIK
jgi:hypothetical protein